MEPRQETEFSVALLADRLLEKLAQAIGELDRNCTVHKVKTKEEGQEITTEYREFSPGGIVDRGGLKQLTGALKELQAIRGEITDLERREREARIESLHRSAGVPETGSGDTGIILLPPRMEEEEESDDEYSLAAPGKADPLSGAEGI